MLAALGRIVGRIATLVLMSFGAGVLAGIAVEGFRFIAG